MADCERNIGGFGGCQEQETQSRVRQAERQKLLTTLLAAVKSCQVRYGGKSELATEQEDVVAELCISFEKVLNHGALKKGSGNLGIIGKVQELVGTSSSEPSTVSPPGFWSYVKIRLSRHELERYMMLKNVKTESGRGRSWLRSALNEHSLERYMHSLLSDERLLASFYEPWAFLRDVERSSMLPQIASGIGSILFAVTIDNPDLDIPTTEPSPPLPEATVEPSDPSSSSGKKKRKVPRQVVSFDGQDGATSSTKSFPVKIQSQKSMEVGSSELPEKQQLSLSFESKIDLLEEEDHQQSRIGKIKDRFRKQLSSEVSGFSVEEDFEGDGGGDEHPAVATAEVSSVGDLSIESESSATPVAPLKRLTPIKNSGVTLIPMQQSRDDVTSSEDSVSVKSDDDYAVQAEAESPGEVGTVSRDEMKAALVSVMGRKDELQDQVESLKILLRKEMNKYSVLSLECGENKRKFEEVTTKQESRIQTLTRENELLKHQLKKYVSAVMKLRDGPQAYETLAKLEGRNNKTTVANVGETDGKIGYVDYHFEASEFERKLIQVAEMHGELLEFNEHLQKVLKVKDMVIRRMREELVDLRGPLPEGDGENGEDVPAENCDAVSIQSMDVRSSRALINIWIPTVFVSGNGSTTHHVYQVYLRIREEEWNIYRRYSEFHSFHKDLLKKDLEHVKNFDFPPKKTIGFKEEKVVEDRRKRLQSYLRNIVNLMVHTNPSLATKPDKEHVVLLMPFFAENSTVARNSSSRATNQRPSLFGPRRRRASHSIPPLAL